MKILGIGNAIVDVICKVNDEFIAKNNLTKSIMKLVDDAEFKKELIANPVVTMEKLTNEKINLYYSFYFFY